VPTPDSVLSHCFGALLPMFTTKEATTLRLLCREFKEAVAEFPWEDDQTEIKGSVGSWRACFPRARWAKLHQGFSRKSPVVDADFRHLRGVKRVNMSWCTQVTDAAFVHLEGIHTLIMEKCGQDTITDAAFVHLKGIHTLDMQDCSQETITDAAFTHLKGIHTLDMSYCCQDTITAAAFVHLKGVHSLCLWHCYQLTSAVFKHIKGIKRLNISYCPRMVITDDSLLEGLEWLNMLEHPNESVRKARSLGYFPVQEITYF
jgi:hypothetical protein